jgi:hypothetical protein
MEEVTDDTMYAALADAFFGGGTETTSAETASGGPAPAQIPPSADSDIYAELLSEDKFEELMQHLPDWRHELSVEARARIIEKM